MDDWIGKLASAEKRRNDEKEKAANEAKEIRRLSTALIKELEKRVQRDIGRANDELYNSKKVFEVRRDIGLFDENRANDFVAMASDYPAATMYVKLYADKRVLIGTLATKQDSESDFRDVQFLKLGLTLDGNGNAVFNGLDLDEVAKIIVEPVVTAHTGAQPTRVVRPARVAATAVAAPMAAAPAESLNFSFVVDSRIAQILERDYKELQRLDPDKSTKSVLVLSGGLIEGLLFDALVANGNYTFERACNEPLKNMIHPALKEKIIRQDKLTDVLRSFRNLIHPAREVKDDLKFTASDAKLAVHAVDIIIGEIREWRALKRKADR